MVATKGETGRGHGKQSVFNVTHENKLNERRNVGSVSTRSRDSAPSQKGCVVNVQMTKTSNKMSTPPPRPALRL